MIDLSTSYLGLKLKNPVVVSASPLCREIGNLRQMEDDGASAVVLHSLFEEQIEIEALSLDRALAAGDDVSAEAVKFFPDLSTYNIGAEGYLEHIRQAKAAVSIPVIASLNGLSSGGWVGHARLMEEAGADALELNIYHVPPDPWVTAGQIEEMYTELVVTMNSKVRIPLSVKLGPFFSAFANFARHLDMSGADGLVMFNRFYQPDFDLENLEVVPTLQLSRSNELRLRLTWVALLYGKIKADMAVTGGVHTAEDVVKCMMAGARVAMTTSALLEHGISYLRPLIADLHDWLEQHEYESITQMQGSMSAKSVRNPSAFERGNYMKVLSSYVPNPGRPMVR
ncbi:MAG: dihydroorotate dehydrogenase-like protein [Terriglobales bacterium]|jgi:dihydroorotate dehydrogenase (fumarate)